MRILTIGDIHGCLHALDTLLDFVQPTRDDTLVTLGDYVDRGPDSHGVIERLLALRDRVYLVPLRGNHELMMLAARHSAYDAAIWEASGGDATLASYGSLWLVPEPHWQFMEMDCIDFWETETHFFVHANVYSGLPLDEQPEYMLFWERFGDTHPHMSGKVMVCGHTSQKNGLPDDRGHAICIDTCAYGGGWLTCFDVTNSVLYQANQAGQTRRFHPGELHAG